MSDLNDFSKENIIVSESIKDLLPDNLVAPRDSIKIGEDSLEQDLVKISRNEKSGLITLDLRVNSFSPLRFIDDKEIVVTVERKEFFPKFIEATRLENTQTDWIIKVSLVEHN